MGISIAHLDTVIVGVFSGAAYALVALSVTLMFRTTGVLSFAHAAFAATGAYLYADLAGSRGLPRPLAALVALAVTVAYGLAVERFAIRPVRHAGSATRLMATVGVLSLTTGLLLQFFGFEPTAAPLLLPDVNVTVGSLRLPLQQIAILAVAGAAALGLGVFLVRTRFGTGVRAVAENPEAARLMGVSLTRIDRFNWALGAAMAGMAGILIAPLQVLTVATFPLLLTKALAATLFGGLVSLPLTFAGGLTVGVVESLTTFQTSVPGARELAVLAVVVVLLAVRRTWPAEVGETPSLSVRWTPSGPGGRLVPWLVGVGVVLAVVVPAGSNYWAFVGGRGLFFVIEALSLVLLVGWGGQVSLMHGAYVGIGAFGTAYLVGSADLPLELAVVIAAVVGMGVGALASLPALRLSGLQFSIASLVFAAAASEWFFKRPELPRTLPRGRLAGLELSDSAVYFVMLALTALLYLLVWNLRRSTFGPLLISARDVGTTVSHFGADPRRTRMAAFMLASFIAALGGALYGVLLSGFQPFDFSLFLSMSLLLYAVVGGVTSLGGPLLAGVLFGVVPQVLQGQAGLSASAAPDIVAGGLVIVLLSLRPDGLASLFRRRFRGREKRRLVLAPRLGGGLAMVGLLGAVAWFPGARSVGATAGPPHIFDVAADAAPVMSVGAFPAAVPLVLTTGVARSSVIINSQPRAQSQAAIVYSPAAETASAVGVPEPPPEARLWCYSYFPIEPAEASCGGPVHDGGLFRITTGTGHTATSGDATDARTLRSASSTSLAGLTAGDFIAFVSGTATASAGAEGDRITGAAGTEIHGLSVSDVLHITSLRSRVTGSLQGTPESGVVERVLLVSGVKVGDVAVTIDGAGVHAVGQSPMSGLDSLQAQVNQVLAGAGLTVRAVPAPAPEVAPDGRSLRVSSGGLLVTFAHSEAASSLLLGQSNLQMAASRSEPPVLPGPAEFPPVLTGPVTEPASPPLPAPPSLIVGGVGPAPRPNALLDDPSTAAPPVAPAANGPVVERPASRSRTAVPAAGWSIPFAPFAVLVLLLPALVQARRLALVPGGPQ